MQVNVDMDIVVDMDQVTVEGQVVKRPNGVSRSGWLRFWEALEQIADCPESECPYKS